MADIHIQHYPTIKIPNLATAAVAKAKNTAANQDIPTATASAPQSLAKLAKIIQAVKIFM